MSSKTTIRFGGKSRRVPKRYVPDSLSESDKRKQVKSIMTGSKRPSVKSYDSKRSSHVKAFERKYGFSIRDKRVETLIAREGINQILRKGRGAYHSSGSRPNTSAEAWAYARLASVLMGGNARKVDRKIYDKYKK